MNPMNPYFPYAVLVDLWDTQEIHLWDIQGTC